MLALGAFIAFFLSEWVFFLSYKVTFSFCRGLSFHRLSLRMGVPNGLPPPAGAEFALVAVKRFWWPPLFHFSGVDYFLLTLLIGGWPSFLTFSRRVPLWVVVLFFPGRSDAAIYAPFLRVEIFVFVSFLFFLTVLVAM